MALFAPFHTYAKGNIAIAKKSIASPLAFWQYRATLTIEKPINKERSPLIYHFSENPDIQRFIPRPAKVLSGMPPVVWAIDAEHAVNYYLPRDCPRVIYARTDTAAQEDIARFFDGSAADVIITVESRWMDRIRETRLYRYTFSDELFVLSDANAGYYVSSEEIVPLRVEPMGDLMSAILGTGAELRFTPSLVPLRQAVIASTLSFSVIRFANAWQMT